MNATRLKALRDAAKDVCMYCGGRAPQYKSAPVRGPSGSGNWIHTAARLWTIGNKPVGGKTVLCLASSILNRITFEEQR